MYNPNPAAFPAPGTGGLTGSDPQQGGLNSGLMSGTLARPLTERKQAEVKLATTREEKQLYDQLGELYSIIVATQHLEKVF